MFLPYLLISTNLLFQTLKSAMQTPRHPTFPPLRVILSEGRSPKSNPEGDRRSGSPNAERTNPAHTSATVKPRGSHIPISCFKSFERGTGKTFLKKSFPRFPPPLIPHGRSGRTSGRHSACSRRGREDRNSVFLRLAEYGAEATWAFRIVPLRDGGVSRW